MALTCARCLMGESWRCRDRNCPNHRGANQPQENGIVPKNRTYHPRVPKPVQDVDGRPVRQPTLVETPLTVAIREALEGEEKVSLIGLPSGWSTESSKKMEKNLDSGAL